MNKLVCLGLGHFSDCPIARVQLGFIIALRDSLKPVEVVLQDPAFTDSEITFLKSIDCIVPEENLKGKFKTVTGEQVLYYLPHCPKQLTNNLLWSNWSEEQLINSILICNSFRELLVNTLEKDIKREAAFIQRISEYTSEQPLQVPPRHFDSFNDTSIHSFELKELRRLEDPISFWKDKEEPQTLETDIELLSNRIEKL